MTARGGILAAAAKGDIRAIVRYVAEHNPVAAETWLTSVEAALQHLAEFPHSGHPRSDLTPQPLLFWTMRPYLIVYRVGDSSIEVVRVLRGSQDVVTILRDR